MINWISVTEKKPLCGFDIIAYHANGVWFNGYFNGDYFRDPYNDNCYSVETVTHWAYINLPGE